MTAGIVIAFAAVGAVLALGPIFVNSTLHAKAAGWGVVVVAFGVGMAIGMAGSNQVTKFIERDLVFTRSLLSAAVALFLLAAMPTFSLAAVVTVWLGLFCGLAWVSGYTLLQENVEDEYRGRTFASLTVLSRLGLFASLTFFPILSSAYDAAIPSRARQRLRRSPERASRSWAAGRPGAHRRPQHAPPPRTVPPQPTPTPRARAEAEAAAGHRPVHRLRRRGGRRQGHADPDGGGAPALARPGRPRDARARRDAARRADPPGAAGPEDGQARRARRGAAVRGEPRADGHVDHPPGARRREDRPVGSLRRLLARVPGVGARPGRAGRAHAERVGDPGPVPRPRDPAARGAGARACSARRRRPTGWSWRARTSTRRSPTPT